MGPNAYVERLLPVLVHIQNHLDGDLSLEALAEHGRFSPFHFHRVFRETVGETVKQYTRRLRLEKAAFQLTVCDATVLDVALDCGFANHETFTRAFGRRFGAPPDRYRRGEWRRATPPQRDSAQSLNRMKRDYQLSKVKIHRFKPVPLAFIRNLGPYADVDLGLFDALIEWSRRRGEYGPEARLIGIGHDAPHVTPPNKLRFDACIRAARPFRAEGRVGCQRLPEGTHAVTTYIGPFGAVMEAAYVEIYSRVAALDGWEMTGLPVFEIYHATRIDPDYALNHTDICIPVTKR